MVEPRPMICRLYQGTEPSPVARGCVILLLDFTAFMWHAHEPSIGSDWAQTESSVTILGVQKGIYYLLKLFMLPQRYEGGLAIFFLLRNQKNKLLCSKYIVVIENVC